MQMCVTGCRKSHMPVVGIEPGPQDLKANTLPRRCESRFLPQGSRSVLYLPIPTTCALQPFSQNLKNINNIPFLIQQS